MWFYLHFKADHETSRSLESRARFLKPLIAFFNLNVRAPLHLNSGCARVKTLEYLHDVDSLHRSAGHERDLTGHKKICIESWIEFVCAQLRSSVSVASCGWPNVNLFNEMPPFHSGQILAVSLGYLLKLKIQNDCGLFWITAWKSRCSFS